MPSSMPEETLSYEDLLALVQTGRELASRIDLEALLQDILCRASNLTNSQGASVILEDERSKGLYFAAALGGTASAALATYGRLSPERVPMHSKAGQVFLSGASLTEQSLTQDQDHFKGVDRETGEKTENMVCVPLSVNEADIIKRLGVLQIINKQSGPYTDRDRILLEHFAAQAAIAIRNSNMFSSLAAHMGFYSGPPCSKSSRNLSVRCTTKK